MSKDTKHDWPEIRIAFDPSYEARFGGVEHDAPRLKITMGGFKIEDWGEYCTINGIHIDAPLREVVEVANAYLKSRSEEK